MELCPSVVDTIFYALQSERDRYESDKSQQVYVAELYDAMDLFGKFLDEIRLKNELTKT